MDDRRKVLVVVGPRCHEVLAMVLGRTPRRRMVTVEVTWDDDGAPSAEARYL
jgi:hypothetical protein